METSVTPPDERYKRLKAYQKALVIDDATVSFCARFFPGEPGLADRMKQAARASQENIVAGVLASATSKQTKINLFQAARVSLEKLLEEYGDFLRSNQLSVWGKDHPLGRQVAERCYQTTDGYATYRAEIEQASPEIAANTIRVVIFYVIFALAKQLYRLKQQSFRKVNMRVRGTTARPHPSPPASLQPRPLPTAFAPACPRCGAAMRCRMARTGLQAGKVYWGCFGYPTCRGTRPMET